MDDDTLHKGDQRFPWAFKKALALIQKIFKNVGTFSKANGSLWSPL